MFAPGMKHSRNKLNFEDSTFSQLIWRQANPNLKKEGKYLKKLRGNHVSPTRVGWCAVSWESCPHICAHIINALHIILSFYASTLSIHCTHYIIYLSCSMTMRRHGLPSVQEARFVFNSSSERSTIIITIITIPIFTTRHLHNSPSSS